MVSKKMQKIWNSLSRRQQLKYLVNNVKSTMGLAKNHSLRLVDAADQIGSVALPVDMRLDDEIQGVRMNCGIDNIDAFMPNLKNLRQSPKNLVKDNLFEESHRSQCDDNSLICDYSVDPNVLRAINLHDILHFGHQVIRYLKHPDRKYAKRLAN